MEGWLGLHLHSEVIIWWGWSGTHTEYPIGLQLARANNAVKPCAQQVQLWSACMGWGHNVC